MRGWSEAMKIWCCEHKSVGCPSRSYDCSAGAGGGPSSWPDSQRFWCCQHEDIGCGDGERYDCKAGYDNWRRGWSDSKKLWCCEKVKRGCTRETKPYDCRAGETMPEESDLWPEEQAKWCCGHWGIGCRAAAAVAQKTGAGSSSVLRGRPEKSGEFDCAAALWGENEEWSEVKKAYCCVTQGLGCELTTSPKPFDCEAGLLHWQQGWPREKTSWCCRNEGLGCAKAATTTAAATSATSATANTGVNKTLYNCTGALSNATGEWSAPHQEWCCRNMHLGCPPAPALETTTPAPQNCTDGEDVNCETTVAATIVPEIETTAAATIVAETAKAIAATTVTAIATAGTAVMATSQDPSTSAALSATTAPAGRAVAAVRTAAASTSTGPASSATATTTLTAIGTASTAPMAASTSEASSQAYDCEAGIPGADSAWSPEKRRWCCQHVNISCSVPFGLFMTSAAPGTVVTTTTTPFDCQAGRQNWEMGWSRRKKSWCCQHQGLGCPAGNASAFYDCWDGLPTPDSGWSPEKRDWCCQNQGVACPVIMVQTVTVTVPVPAHRVANAPTPQPNESSCFDEGVRYDPIDMFGTSMTQENGARECQDRCARTMGCAHFSYFHGGGYCHIQDDSAVAGFGLQVTSGPPSCMPVAARPCYEVSTIYFPVMQGLGVSFANETAMKAREVVKTCKRLCAAQEGCAHYVVQFPERTCEFAGASAVRISRLRAVSGPAVCNRTLGLQGKFAPRGDTMLSGAGFLARATAGGVVAGAVLAALAAAVRQSSRSGACRRVLLPRAGRGRGRAATSGQADYRYSALSAVDPLPLAGEGEGEAAPFVLPGLSTAFACEGAA